jgi:MtN3 and saliva related transmembrane protein
MSIIELLAPILTCCQLMPQVHKVYKNRNIEGLSLLSIFLVILSNSLWTIHAIRYHDTSLIIASIISVLVGFVLLSLYFKFRNTENYKKDDKK